LVAVTWVLFFNFIFMNKEFNSDLLQNISKLSDGNVIKFLLGASEQGKFPPEISDCITKVVDYMNENEVRVDPGFRYSLNISLFRKDKYWIRTITDRVTGEILYETKTRQCFPDNRTIYTELEYGLFGSSIYHPNYTIQRNKQ
jgi:hypothetical protein